MHNYIHIYIYIYVCMYDTLLTILLSHCLELGNVNFIVPIQVNDYKL